MNKARIRAWMTILSGAVLWLSTAWALYTFFTRMGTGNMAVRGALCFRYFTVDSNILVCLLSLPGMAGAVRALRSGEFTLSAGAVRAKFVGAAAVGLTFTVVMVFLGPLFGYGAMFRGLNLYLHLVNPLLAMASLIFWERGPAPERRDLLWAALPMVVYGLIYLTMVMVVKGWRDFYGFNIGGFWYISYLAVLAAQMGIAALLRLGCRAVGKKETNIK